jgi:hypothetical protein
MEVQPMFIQKGSTHYNVKNIIKMVTGSDNESLKLYFIDGSDETLKFDDDCDYDEFIRHIHSLICD